SLKNNSRVNSVMSAQPEKRYFNVDEYYRMARAGVLTPDDRVELIEGEIVKMSPIGSPHAACVSRLDDLLRGFRRKKASVRIQSPIRLNDFSEPVPDVALLKPREDYYATRHPGPADVLLIIEVAETTVISDRNVKVPLYARNSIPEVWLVNLPKKLIEEYFEVADGRYLKSKKYKRGENIVSATIPGLSLRVSDILD
ncbi:MAG TPA: Uma2 family endonuclease, partial [Pyrinomonadaceae bacterium]|nr:Uma2 family endonuclease [Pyrinomonadaceae bacterium]